MSQLAYMWPCTFASTTAHPRCNVTAAQAWLFGDLISTFFVLMLADHTQSGCSIEEVLHYIDNSIQYGEDADVKIRDFENEDADEPDE